MADRDKPLTKREIAAHPTIVNAMKNAFRRGLSRDEVKRVIWADAPNEALESCEREVKKEDEAERKRALEKEHERQAR